MTFPPTRAPDEDLLDLVEAVRRVFGAVTLHIQHPDRWQHFAIPAPPGYQLPKRVQMSAHRASNTTGRSR